MNKTSSKFRSIVKQVEVSDQAKSSVGSGRFHSKIVANLFLIWLDEEFNDSNVFYNNTMSQLCQVTKMLKVYKDRDQCVDFLTDIQTEDTCLIISEDISQQIIPFIHDFDRPQSIFILRRNPNHKKHDEWTKNWFKLKGVYTETSTICDIIRQTAQRCEQNAVSFSLLDTNDNLSRKKLDQLDPMFMYSQMLSEIILDIPFDEQHFIEFIDYCRQTSKNNDAELRNINEFRQKYHTKSAIEWYTSERFLYTTLNRGLRIVDADTIMQMGYFIVALYRQIEQLHAEQYPTENFSESFIVYRGQVVPKIELDKIKKIKGGLLAFNSFLSTSRRREVSSMFAGDDQIDADFVGILFIIKVDPSKSTAAFASIKDISQFPEEEEMLFVMHAVFRIVNIKPMTDISSRLFEMELALSSETDKDLAILRNHTQKAIPSSYTGWEKFASVLFDMGLSNKAQEIYERRLVEVNEEDKRVMLYNALGMTYFKQGKYEISIGYYTKVLNIEQQALPSNHPDLAFCYNNIGLVYSNMGDYSKALLCYEKAFEIEQQSLPSNHPVSASYYGNIGNEYWKMGAYSKALLSYEKAVEIEQRSLPSNHPDLASSYHNIGALYSKMGDYSKALLSYEKAVEIEQRSLPSNHPDLASSYYNIGNVYSHMGDYSKAVLSYEKALEFRQQSLPSNHPDIASSYNSIGAVYYHMGAYSQALLTYEKALEIQQQSLSSNHPDLAHSYNNIDVVYSDMGDYSKALLTYEKALKIRQQSLPCNHPDLATSYNNIGLVYSHKGDYSKATLSHEKALEIQQQSLSSNHPDLAHSYNNIGNVYSDMGDYSKALLSYEKALEIQQQSLPSNHPHLSSCYNNIGNVYSKMGGYSKAILSYEKALEIQHQSLPSNHPDLASCYHNVGAAYYHISDYSKAASYYERAMNIFKHSLPPNHPSLQTLRENLEKLNRTFI